MKFFVLLMLISLSGLSAAENVAVSGTVQPYVHIDVFNKNTILLSPSPMSPNTNPHTAGNFLVVQTNCPYQIDTLCNPANGKMASVATGVQLHQVMSAGMNSHAPFPLNSPVPEIFTTPAPAPEMIPLTFFQNIGYDDTVLAPSDSYRLIATFTISSH